MNKNYNLKNGNYLKIEKTDKGYEYAMYKECKILMSCGIIKNLALNDTEVLKEVFKKFNIPIESKYQKLNEEIEESNKLNEKVKSKISNLFIKVSDEVALKELYKETKDPLVKVLLKWRKEYEEELESVHTIAYDMYSDLIEYIYKKYKLNN